jgi:hypothetical protein
VLSLGAECFVHMALRGILGLGPRARFPLLLCTDLVELVSMPKMLRILNPTVLVWNTSGLKRSWMGIYVSLSQPPLASPMDLYRWAWSTVLTARYPRLTCYVAP